MTAKSPNQNLPISYDFHGDIPFETPFADISPNDIHVYLDLDTRVGKNNCGQACAHCWFVNYEKAHNKFFDMHEGRKIKDQLENKGYKVFARYTDSFALDGEFMKLFGPVHNREFRQEHDHIPTKTMVKGDAWTSGAPLLTDQSTQLLNLARQSGYGTISITFHGLIDENLELLPSTAYPIKGVFSGQKLEQVAEIIREDNKSHPGEELRLNIGITVGRHNNSRDSLVRYARYFNRMGVATVRFNCFTDHGGRHPHLQMSISEIEQAYRDLKWLHENIELNFQLGVSEDFGTNGIEVMEFPTHVGWCRAGRQLFTVIPAMKTTELYTVEQNVKVEQIGDIVACVNIFEPYLGALLRSTDLNSGEVTYRLNFDHVAIDRFSHDRVTGVYKDGCFAKDMLKTKKPELTKTAQTAVARSLELELA